MFLRFFSKKIKKEIFLDHASGTPIDSEVFLAMRPYFETEFYNPSAIYAPAVAIQERLFEARKNIAQILHARPQEIIFNDGGSEANNTALFGVVSAWQKKHPQKKPHIITSHIEHSSVLEACRKLEHNGCEVSYVSVDKQGRINLKELKESIQENTILVSVGYVNGEIGVIQDVKSVAKTIRHYRKHQKTMYPYFHTDAVQAVNYLPLTMPQLGVDLMTINGSKIYGPKKMAVLYIKTDVEIDPIIVGGGQEMGMRAGTENIPAIVGMEKALGKALDLHVSETERLKKLQDYFVDCIEKKLPNVLINAQESEKIPNIVNISIPDLSSEEIILRLDAEGVMASVKSACKSGEDGDSHVILALRGANPKNTGSIRFSMGRTTTREDIQRTIEILKKIIIGMQETQERYS